MPTCKTRAWLLSEVLTNLEVNNEHDGGAEAKDDHVQEQVVPELLSGYRTQSSPCPGRHSASGLDVGLRPKQRLALRFKVLDDALTNLLRLVQNAPRVQ